MTKVVLAAAAAAVLALGCGSDKDKLEKRLSALQEEVVAVQNANDRLAERMMALEMRRMQPERAAAPAAAAPDSIERPPLKVVKLGPGGAAPAAPEAEAEPEAEEDPNRPVIRDIGSGRAKARPVGQNGAVKGQ